jgi:hypothetical protein
MTDAQDADLRQRTWKLLQPGEIDLDGLVIHTDYSGNEDTQMHQATVEIGDIIAEHSGIESTETFVYSGTDDPEFASNQHQGLTLDDESFVWECQQLLRDGSFDIVFYYVAAADSHGILADVAAAGYPATALRGDASDPESAVIDHTAASTENAQE